MGDDGLTFYQRRRLLPIREKDGMGREGGRSVDLLEQDMKDGKSLPMTPWVTQRGFRKKLAHSSIKGRKQATEHIRGVMVGNCGGEMTSHHCISIAATGRPII